MRAPYLLLREGRHCGVCPACSASSTKNLFFLRVRICSVEYDQKQSLSEAWRGLASSYLLRWYHTPRIRKDPRDLRKHDWSMDWSLRWGLA